MPMTDHCFISYSTIDALEFARKLANELEGGDDKYIDAWFDKRDLKAGIDWRAQLPEAIRECKVLLFVMTKDSVEPQSMTNEEWAFALKYKKPIIPLRLHSDTDLPFGFGRRQWIDFTGEFEHGLAQLRKRLADLDSPKGQLQLLRDRLADAERDLKRATAEDEVRITAEIEQLKNDIKQQDVVVKNPDYAEKRTRKNISAGLQEEQRSAEIKSETPSTKFINPIPLIAPNYFQGRLPELSQIADFLNNDHQRILTIIGRGGGGKTALSCYLLKNLEFGRLPDGLGEYKAGGIVYLSEIGSHKVSFANIYSGLLQLLPAEIAGNLDILYREPKISVGEKVRQLLEFFQQERIIVLLDNFESFIDTETENLIDVELQEALGSLLRTAQHSIKIIITTRVPARNLAFIEPSRHNTLHLEEGLNSPFAENVLRAMDVDGRAGFRDASKDLLNRARELTLGFPRALESLYAIISVDRYTSIDELLAVDLPTEVVENLVGEAFSRLDADGQKVMQALSVYNRPITPAAIDFLLQFHIPGVNCSPVLNRLVSMHFARREVGRFYLHPVDREYAFRHIPEGKSDKHIGKGARGRTWNQHALILRAADYYVESRKPEKEWRKLDDLAPQLAEFDLRCATEDYDTAAKLLHELDYNYLRVWGHYRLIIDLFSSINEKIQDKELQIGNLISLAGAYGDIGMFEKALVYYQQGMLIANITNSREDQAVILGNMAGIYSRKGEIEKAIGIYEKNISFWREVKSKPHETTSLINLGVTHTDIGESEKGIEFLEQALVINGKNGSDLSKTVIHTNIGDAFLNLNNIQEALSCYKIAVTIADKIGFLEAQNYARWGLTQACLVNEDLMQAYTVAVVAQTYFVPKYNHNISSLRGIIAMLQGDKMSAKNQFHTAINQANSILTNTSNYYDALDAKGIALSGLALLEDKKNILLAKEAFHEARKVTKGAGIIKRTMRIFDELAKADSEGALTEMRLFIEGKE